MHTQKHGQKKRIFVITADKIVPTGQLTFHFIFDVNYSFVRMIRCLDENTFSIPYGMVQFRRPSAREPRDLFFPSIRLEPRSKRISFQDPIWEVAIGNQRQQIIYIEARDETELVKELRRVPECILLMEHCDYKDWYAICSIANIAVDAHHHQGTLWTSRGRPLAPNM